MFASAAPAMGTTWSQDSYHDESDTLLSEKDRDADTSSTALERERHFRPHHRRLVVVLAGMTILGGLLFSVWRGAEIQRNEYHALRELCMQTQWRSGLYSDWTISYGLNNLRTELSVALKGAVDAGAGLILPKVALRQDSQLTAWEPAANWEITSLRRYFNVDQLKQDVQTWCPGLEIIEEDPHHPLKDFKRVSDVARGEWDFRWGRLGPGTYRKHFDEILKRHNVTEWSAEKPVVVHETMIPIGAWNYQQEAFNVSMAWFDMVEYSPRLMRLANQLRTHPLLQSGPFIGVHLRVEADAAAAGFFLNFEQQVGAYRRELDKRNFTTIFVAGGLDDHQLQHYRDSFNDTDVRIITKWDLLEDQPDLAEEISVLHFDGRAVLDYSIMLDAELVLGVGMSTFALFLGEDRRIDRQQRFSSTLHLELFPPGSEMVGDNRTLILPPVQGPAYNSIP